MNFFNRNGTKVQFFVDAAPNYICFDLLFFIFFKTNIIINPLLDSGFRS